LKEIEDKFKEKEEALKKERDAERDAATERKRRKKEEEAKEKPDKRIVIGEANNPHRQIINHDGKS